MTSMITNQPLKTLPPHLRKNGFNYALVLRGERSCIYRQTVAEDLYYYEVFIIKIQPKKEFKGVVMPAKERFPHNEAFGYWAWTYRGLDKAMKKFKELEGHT